MGVRSSGGGGGGGGGDGGRGRGHRKEKPRQGHRSRCSRAPHSGHLQHDRTRVSLQLQQVLSLGAAAVSRDYTRGSVGLQLQQVYPQGLQL